MVDDNNNEVVFTHPYIEEHLDKLQYIQSADVLYITHPKYRPAKITRSSHINWTFDYLFFTNVVPTPDILNVKAGTPLNDKTYTYGITLVDKDGNEGELFKATEEAHIGDILDFEKSQKIINVLNIMFIDKRMGYSAGWVVVFTLPGLTLNQVELIQTWMQHHHKAKIPALTKENTRLVHVFIKVG